MLNIVTVILSVGFAAGVVWVLLRSRRRDVGFAATVSRQWLLQHQGDERP
jgi:hypothetical protein